MGNASPNAEDLLTVKLFKGVAVPVLVLAAVPVVAAFLLLTILASPFMMAYSLWRGKM